MEDRATRDAELTTALVALVLLALLNARDALIAAGRAGDALRPSRLLQVLAAGLVAMELVNQFGQVHSSSPLRIV